MTWQFDGFSFMLGAAFFAFVMVSTIVVMGLIERRAKAGGGNP